MANQVSSIVSQAEEFASKILKNESNSKFSYHNFSHTTDVVAATEKIMKGMNMSEEDMEVLQISAWFHDLGYTVSENNHEEESVKIAEKFLKDLEYDPSKIERVNACIMATRMPQSPQTVLEEIICDADMAHLGGDNYLEKSEKLRNEFEKCKGSDIDELGWLSMNKAFLGGHSYFTPYAQEHFQKGREHNLKLVQEELDKMMPTGSEKEMAKELKQLRKKLEKAEAKTEKLIKEKPGRGVETMFRLTSKNHIDLSSMADTKANIMISINSIILSVVVTVLIRKLEEYPHLTVPSLFLTLVCLATIVIAILATRPNIMEGKFNRDDIEKRKTNLLFFGNFHGVSIDEYEFGMKEMIKDSDYLYSSLIKDIYYLGKVLGRKYKLLRLCYTIFMFGFVISILSFIVAETFFAAPYPY